LADDWLDGVVVWSCGGRVSGKRSESSTINNK